ncbi:MAG TPA: winged helix-turn-helix domain-containing protein [Steroidobacter sp.]|jgi:adenylate cyclase|nr:winged helix-turn-helix domain-containing protein [Steroidobacter sp.]
MLCTNRWQAASTLCLLLPPAQPSALVLVPGRSTLGIKSATRLGHGRHWVIRGVACAARFARMLSAQSAQGMEPTAYRLEDLTIDVVHQRVTRDGTEIPLSGLSFDLLLALVRGDSGLVTYDQLLEKVWPGQVVNLETVTQRMKIIRDALGEDVQAPRYFTAVRGRGYRTVTAAALVFPADTGNPPESPASTTRVPLKRPLRSARLAAAIAMPVLAAMGLAYFSMSGDARRASTSVSSAIIAPDKSVAVLPFVNLSGDAEQEYFSDGLTEELLNRLAGLPGLKVPARTSSFQFKGKALPTQTVGHALGVRYLLEGSVRQSGDRLRVAVQLIEADTGYHKWSRTFERTRADIFAVQDEIALAVATALQLTLLGALTRHSTTDPRALDLYFRAKQLHQSFHLDRMAKAVEYYEEAIQLDPRYSAAYVGLADVIFMTKQMAELRPEDPYLARVGPLLRTALEVDPDNGDAHALLGTMLQDAFDFAGAERELRAAESVSPNGEYVLRYLTNFYLQAAWPPEKALEYAVRARMLDPLNPWTDVQVGWSYLHMHDYQSALQEFERVLEVHPTFWVAEWGRGGALDALGQYEEALKSALRVVAANRFGDTETTLAMAYARLGKDAEARAILERLGDPARGKYWSSTFRAALLTTLGDRAGALAALEDAYEERDFQLAGAMHSKWFEPLHGEARFRRLVTLLGQEKRVEHARQAWSKG